ncbi:MAG: transglycosylase domain-containing protein [Acidimicrobiales bacterium]|nr:transglycosylase domain-containing protein [Acidimicrobiales bacterium]
MKARAPRPGLARRPLWRRSTRGLVRVAVVLVLGIPLFVAGAGASGLGLLLYGELPGTTPEPREPFTAVPSKVYDAYGVEIAEFREFDLTLPMAPEDIPQTLKNAVVAGEDHTFYTHTGIDPVGLVRAARANAGEGEVVQGGSTITQQLVREKYLTRERSFERKFNEVLLSTRFERDLADELGSTAAAKDQIMFEYLESVYFGGGAYGAAAAAETYFRKPLSELTVSESALLAGIIPAPSKYGPRENLTLAEERRQFVLKQMRDLGMLTDAELTAELDKQIWYAAFGEPPKAMTVVYPPPQTSYGRYPYFVDYVRRYLVDRYGPELVYRGGLQIYTSIDPRLQDLAEQTVTGALAGTSSPLEMSLVSVEPATGQVKALVGGRDFAQSQVNLALGGSVGMQPGSVFKVYTLAKALEEGYTPETVYDAPGVLYVPGCGGQCAIRGGSGPTTLRAATANSTNTYFYQLAIDLGGNNVAELANRLGVTGITLDKDYSPGITLGQYEVSPLDIAASMGVIANHGVKADATPIAKLVAQDGTVLEDNTLPHGQRVLNAAVADWTTELLRGVITDGTGTRAAIGRPAAGKTGTAQEYRAAWFAGYTPQLSTAIWLGYSDTPKPLRGIGGFNPVYGGTLPAKTWSTFMKGAHSEWPVAEFVPPGPLPPPSSGIREVPAGGFTPFVLPRDCGGPCVVTPGLTTPTLPPTTAPPDEGPSSGDAGSSTTTSTTPVSTTTGTGPSTTVSVTTTTEAEGNP